MELVDPKDISKAIKIRGKKGIQTSKLLMSLLRIRKINKIYSKIYDLPPDEFLNEIIKLFRINFEISDEDISKIPDKGAFITVSNHPYGGIDGILLIKIIAEKRPDFKVMANFLLQSIKPMKDYFLPVNPFENKKEIKSSFKGIKLAIQHLQEGKPLGIFPAGEVSAYNSDAGIITDKQWQNPALNLIKKARVPVIPVYFQGTNSRLFHILGLVHPLLRTAKLPSELFNKKRKVIKIKIGNPISVKDQDDISDISRYGRFLRAKTYSLGTSLEIKRFFRKGILRLKKAEKIIDPVDVNLLIGEVRKISKTDLLLKQKNFEVYCSSSENIPNLLTEIGRLRELTFREAGEGTNRSLDVDEYDLYYNQLFIWDSNAKKIVGAYRVGKGKEILSRYGKKGLYIESLFKIKKPFESVLKESIELGRSFIVKDYQKQIAPLFLLWKGILYLLLKNPEYRYLLGPVSISNMFSKFSKSIIIKFIKANYFDYNLAGYITPRKKFRVKPDAEIDTDIFIESTTDDLNKLDKIIEDIEPNHFKLPVLIKKYLKLNAKIIGFNIDPKFNNALDGLIILDLYEVPLQTIETLSKEINDKTILDRFNTKQG